MSEEEKQFHKEPTTEIEKKEEPRISFEIFYSAHRTAKDIEKMADLFSRADIYVPEGYNWTPEVLADFQALSRGEKTPNELGKKYYGVLGESAKAKRLEIIYQSQKPILFADLGKEHKVEEINSQADALYWQSFKEFKNGNFPVALQIMRESTAKYAEYDQKREEIIKANLKTRIKEMIENNPQFKNKKEIKVLLSLGAAHTHLYQDLKKEKPSTLRQFANLPSVFLSAEEAIRRLMFSKELKDELLTKIFIEHFLNNCFKQITNDTDKKDRIIRKMTARISLDEIKNLSENWDEEKSKDLPVILREFFRNKGIKIPKNEKEMDEMLKLTSSSRY